MRKGVFCVLMERKVGMLSSSLDSDHRFSLRGSGEGNKQALPSPAKSGGTGHPRKKYSFKAVLTAVVFCPLTLG